MDCNLITKKMAETDTFLFCGYDWIENWTFNYELKIVIIIYDYDSGGIEPK